MILVGLTGGMGSGKSLVSSQLAAHGAVVVDADAIVRDLQLPGQKVFAQIVERFGAQVLAASGHLDRGVVASIVFGDASALADLNRIVHPAVGHEMMRRINEHRNTTKVVILDVPLLGENPRTGLSGLVVVYLDPEIAVERLVAQRGFTIDDARSRIARQAPRSTRRAAADWIIDNSGSRLDLARHVGAAWAWMCCLPPAQADAGRVAGALES